MSTTRVHPASVKLVCLGLGRTGTSSLRKALEMLGFGPCYHMGVTLREDGKDFLVWSKIGDGNFTSETFDELFRDYPVIVDYSVAMYPAELYAAYPDAKFILTTRDPAKWEKSMRSTILRAADILRTKEVKTGFQGPLAEWLEKYLLGKYHRGRLYTHTQQEILDHNERVKKLIPLEKLLVYEIGEGWDRLVDFLAVPKPEDEFPHINDTETFEKNFLRGLSS